MRRLSIIALVLLGVVAGGLFAVRNQLADSIARRALKSLTSIAAERGVTVDDLVWSEVRFGGLRSLTFAEVRGHVRLRTGLIGRDAAGERLGFRASQVGVSVKGWSSGTLELVVVSGEVDLLDLAGQPSGQKVSDVTGRVRTEFSLGRWRDDFGTIEVELRRLVREGRSSLFVEAQALAHFEVNGRWHDVKIQTATMSGDSVILLDRDDLERVSKSYVHALTEAEIDLVVRNPVRAPALLRLSEKAAAAAEVEQRRDRTFPADAYRHVYWSWLLTREFGPEFSEEVTDAHEVGATYERGTASRRMDLHNNAIGRAYALAGVAESELAGRVKTDPNVQRSLRGK